MNYLKTYLLIFFLIFLQICTIHGHDIVKGSLAFVIDATRSMDDEIQQVKESASYLFDTVVQNKASQIENFILVIFRDPDAHLVAVTKDPYTFKKAVADIRLIGNRDCPEFSMTGIKLALESSLPQSLVYVFTDAAAKDYHMYEAVRSLAQKNQDQVTFMLTGECVSRSDANYQVYHQLAKATRGDVYNVVKGDIADMINVVIENIKGSGEIVAAGTFPPGRGHEIEINVDGKMGDVVISVTGKNPSIDIKDHVNKSVETKDIVKKEEVWVTKLTDPKPGNYTAVVGSETTTEAKVKAKSLVNIQARFSDFEPTSITDTVTRPAPEGHTILSIQLHGEGVKLEFATILDMSGNEVKRLPLRLIDDKTKFYVAESFNPPQAFRVIAFGHVEADKSPIKRETATPIERQNLALVSAENVAPVITIEGAPEIITDYNAPVQIKCNVHAYPKPDITWKEKDTGTILTAKVFTKEIPYDYISILDIKNVNKNSTYECKATNSNGGNFQYINVRMNTYFNIIEAPIGVSYVEYDEELRIVCKVDAHPPATITWHKGGRKLSNNSNILISGDITTLTIEHVKIESQGKYICEAKNDIEEHKFASNLAVYGLKYPKINKTDTEVHVLKGNDTQLACRIIEGKPWPTIQWYFQSKSDAKFVKLEETTEILDIKTATFDDVGTYECIARNLLGYEQYAVELVINYPPSISDTVTSILVKDGDVVTIPCNVDGVPSPVVTWSNNKEELHDSADIVITTNYTLKFHEIKVSDAGIYTCEAKNKYGSVKTEVDVDVYVPVNLRVPKVTSITTLVGTNLPLLCDADGYPRPEIKWIYNNFSGTSAPKIILRPNVKKATLKLKRVQLKDEGYYTCSASNVGGSLNLTYEVQVYAPPVMENIYKTKTFKTIKGDWVLIIKCRATGHPKPTIVWQKNKSNIPSGTDWYDIENGALIIKNIDEKSQGFYVCVAENDVGHDYIGYEVDVDEYPYPDGHVIQKLVEKGKSEIIPCDIPHSKIDLLRWYKDGRMITTGELRLGHITPDDAGVYSCRVSSMTKSLSAHVNITVGTKPKFWDEEDRDILPFSLHATAELNCDATGVPEPKVSWKLNNKIIDETTMIYDLVMRLDNIGTYTCEVKNGLGSISRSFTIVAKECIFNTRKDFSGTNQPIMYTPSLSWPSYKVIDHFMILNQYDRFYLHCSKGFSIFPPNYLDIMVTCIGGEKVTIYGRIYKYSDFKCNEETDLTIIRNSTRCMSRVDTESIQIGYTLNGGFLKVFVVCLDKTNNVPLYTQHQLFATQHTVTEMVTKWYQDDILPFEFDSMYDCYNQIEDISSTLRTSFRDYDYNCCFDKRHLVNAKDLRPEIPIAAAYTYLNVVPHWSTCNSKNWADIEDRVRKLAKSFRNPLTISTGIAKPLQLTSSISHKENINLYDNRGRMQPVAEYLWKVVVDPASARGLAIIQVNVPDLSPSEVSRHVLCRDICHRVKWLQGTNLRDVTNGYTYCCSVTNFESEFHFDKQFSKGRIGMLTDIFYSPKHT